MAVRASQISSSTALHSNIILGRAAGSSNLLAYSPAIGLDSGNVPQPPENPEEPAPGQKSVALFGDYRGQLEELLSSRGFAVAAYSRGQVDELISVMGDFDALVALRLDTPADITQLKAAADAAGVGQVYLGGYPLPTSALGALTDHVGDPVQVDAAWQQGPVTLTVAAEHPVLDGFTAGENVVLVDGMDNDYQSFDGYSGSVIGTSAMSSGLGGLLGIQENASGTREVVCGGLGPNEFTDTTAWTSDGRSVLVNAVTWVSGE